MSLVQVQPGTLYAQLYHITQERTKVGNEIDDFNGGALLGGHDARELGYLTDVRPRGVQAGIHLGTDADGPVFNAPTTTTEGLTVTAVKDSQTYPTGLKVTDEDLARLHLLRDAFHGEWNYTIKPQD